MLDAIATAPVAATASSLSVLRPHAYRTRQCVGHLRVPHITHSAAAIRYLLVVSNAIRLRAVSNNTEERTVGPFAVPLRQHHLPPALLAAIAHQ